MSFASRADSHQEPTDPRAPAVSRRLLLGATGGLALTALAGCSKGPDAPAAAAAPAAPTPATPPAPAAPAAPDAARQAFEAASRGTGFVVGQAMSAREIRVFFDPQCPHCAALWAASKPLLDRIRMVWMPVAFIGPTSAPQGALLLAAQDPAARMDEHESLLAKGQGGLAVGGPADGGLVEKISANTQLWRELKAESVPYQIYRVAADGPYGVQAGGLPTDQLVQMLKL